MSDTIFVVDDDPDLVEIVTYVIADGADRRVHGYSDPLRALADVPRLRPDLCIVDLWMPMMDGETFVRNVRARVPSVFLIITGIDGYVARDIAARLGVPVLVKPFGVDEIRAMTDLLLKGGARTNMDTQVRKSVDDLALRKSHPKALPARGAQSWAQLREQARAEERRKAVAAVAVSAVALLCLAAAIYRILRAVLP